MSVGVSDALTAILLGLLEGVSEFLPISSTGHLIVGASLLNLAPALRGSFEITIQAGAVLALLLHYGRDLAGSLWAMRHDSQARHFWAGIVVASLPAGFVGFLLRDWIKQMLFTPTVVALALLVGGIVLLLTDRLPHRQAAGAEGQLTLRQALLIGLVQTLALIPGVSRSAATIVGGMRVGLDRRSATRYSFWLAIPLLGSATLSELLDVAGRATTAELGILLLGCAVSAAVAWLAIAWLLQFVSRHGLAPFGWYRIGFGVLLLLATQTGILPATSVA